MPYVKDFELQEPQLFDDYGVKTAAERVLPDNIPYKKINKVVQESKEAV